MWRLGKQNALLLTGPQKEVAAVRVVSVLKNMAYLAAYMATVESHLQSQRAAIKMLYERILVLVQYVTEVIAGV
jgi:hypothetical protein